MKKLLVLTGLLLAINLISGKDVSVTVYNNDLGLIKEVKEIELEKGVNNVKIENIASRIITESVSFLPLDNPKKISVLEQNYEYDLLNSNKIMSKYIGKKITVYYSENNMAMEGILLSNDYFQQKGNIGYDSSDFYEAGWYEYLTLAEGENGEGGIHFIRNSEILKIDFPKLPKGLIMKPALVWEVDSKVSNSEPVELRYLTNGISWKSDYTAVMNKDDSEMKLSAWVTINNRTGADYENAELKIVAGDLNVVKERYRGGRQEAVYLSAKSSAPKFEEESLFEYHMYTLDKKVNIKHNQQKQITLIQPADAKIEKKLIFFPDRYDKVRTYIESENTKKNGLGMPLPKGKIRAYKEDSSGNLQFIGEDVIDHTPEKGKISVLLGDAFDVFGEQKEVDRRSQGRNIEYYDYEVKITNSKSEKIKIIYRKYSYGRYSSSGSNVDISSDDVKFKKADSMIYETEIEIQPKRTFEFKFTIKVEKN